MRHQAPGDCVRHCESGSKCHSLSLKGWEFCFYFWPLVSKFTLDRSTMSRHCQYKGLSSEAPLELSGTQGALVGDPDPLLVVEL